MNKLTTRGNLKSQSITNEVLINKRTFKIFNIRKIRRAKC
jgi:hypothetical protein